MTPVEGHDKKLHCRYCNTIIYFDDNRISQRTGKKYLIEVQTGAIHRCTKYIKAMKKQSQARTEWQIQRRNKCDDVKHPIKFLPRTRKRTTGDDEEKPKYPIVTMNENLGDEVERPLTNYRPPDIKEWQINFEMNNFKLHIDSRKAWPMQNASCDVCNTIIIIT